MTHYVKLKSNPQFWFVNADGRRTPLHSVKELEIHGWPLPLETISEDELEAIPLAEDDPPAKSKPKAAKGGAS